jgi:hypothetical protein
MAKLPIPKLPAGFKYNPSKLQSGGRQGSSIHRSNVQDTLASAASSGIQAPAKMPLSRVANVNKGSNPDSIVSTYKNLTAPARPARPAAAPAPAPKSRAGRQRELESAFTGKGSNDYFRRHRSAPKTSYSAADREAYLTKRQANKTRGREEGVRISKGRDREAMDLLSKPASGSVDDMVARNKALGREERFNARLRKNTSGQVVGRPEVAPKVAASGGTNPKVSGKNTGSAGTSGRINLGEAIGDGTFGDQAMGSLKMARKNFSSGMADKGGAVSYMGRAAVQGAVWGGGIGGTISAAQGGDFWAGAKEGAFKGAVGVAGYKGIKAATKSTSAGDILANGKAIWQHHGKGNVSKAVVAQQRLHQNI